MMEIVPWLLPLLFVLACCGGWKVQRHLSDHHRARETVEAIRVILSMLMTFAALALGLLTSSAKNHFDATEASLQIYGIDLISLDQRLREYGSAADPIRASLRAYTAAAIVNTWPEEPEPPGAYPRHQTTVRPRSAESLALGTMLLQIDDAVGRLAPADNLQRGLAATLAARMNDTLQQRWLVVAAAQPTASFPFVAVMTLWLSLVFVMFGLIAPANPVVFTAVVLTALSVSAAMWLLVELDSPLSGLFKVTSISLREALMHMDQPGVSASP